MASEVEAMREALALRTAIVDDDWVFEENLDGTLTQLGGCETLTFEEYGEPDTGPRQGFDSFRYVDRLICAVREERDRKWLVYLSDVRLDADTETSVFAGMGYAPDGAGGWRKRE